MRLYEWAKLSLKQTAIYCCSKDDIQYERMFWQPKFDSAVTISGIKQLHAFIPTTEGLLIKMPTSSVDFHFKIVNMK